MKNMNPMICITDVSIVGSICNEVYKKTFAALFNSSLCTAAQSGRFTDQDDFIPEERSDQAMMRQLPEAEKVKINEQIRDFKLEKKKLDLEFAKWDDSGNDIIVVAKQMCMIMMEMTDFTR